MRQLSLLQGVVREYGFHSAEVFYGMPPHEDPPQYRRPDIVRLLAALQMPPLPVYVLFQNSVPIAENLYFFVADHPPRRKKCRHCNRGPGGKQEVVLHACARCRGVMFCGKDCQRAAWRVHKMECEPFDIDLCNISAELETDHSLVDSLSFVLSPPHSGEA